MRKLVALGLIPFTLLAAAAAGPEVEFTSPIATLFLSTLACFTLISEAKRLTPDSAAGFGRPNPTSSVPTCLTLV